MNLEDFLRSFSLIEICMLTPDSVTDEHKRKWELRIETGRWQSGVNAGGCRNFITYFDRNPQIRLAKLQETVPCWSSAWITPPQIFLSCNQLCILTAHGIVNKVKKYLFYFFRVKLEEPDDDCEGNGCSIVIALMRKDKRRLQRDVPIGFAVYKVVHDTLAYSVVVVFSLARLFSNSFAVLLHNKISALICALVEEICHCYWPKKGCRKSFKQFYDNYP